jgi:hypothetical protein
LLALLSGTPCRWRLHLDAASSRHALQESAAAAPSGIGQQQHQQQQPFLGDAQLRTRDPATERIVVQFESPQAAALALDAAAEVAAAAAAANANSSPFDELIAAAGKGEQQQLQQQVRRGSAFAGGWLVDLLHAAVHRAIVSSSS